MENLSIQFSLDFSMNISQLFCVCVCALESIFNKKKMLIAF